MKGKKIGPELSEKDINNSWIENHPNHPLVIDLIITKKLISLSVISLLVNEGLYYSPFITAESAIGGTITLLLAILPTLYLNKYWTKREISKLAGGSENIEGENIEQSPN